MMMTRAEEPGDEGGIWGVGAGGSPYGSQLSSDHL